MVCIYFYFLSRAAEFLFSFIGVALFYCISLLNIYHLIYLSVAFPVDERAFLLVQGGDMFIVLS